MDGCEKFELDMIDYLDGTIDEKRLHAFIEHINGCPACFHRLEMMRVLMAETSDLSAQLPEGLHEQIMEQIMAEQGANVVPLPKKKKHRPPVFTMLAALAAAISLWKEES